MKLSVVHAGTTYTVDHTTPAMGYLRYTVETPLPSRDEALAIEIMRAIITQFAPGKTVSADGKQITGSGADLEFAFITTAGEKFSLFR